MAAHQTPSPSPTIPFDFQPKTRLVFGINVVEQVGELAAELSAKKVLLVTDPGIVAVGHVARGLHALERGGIDCEVVDAGFISDAPEGAAVCWRYDRNPNNPVPDAWTGWSRATLFPGQSSETDL